MSNMYYLATLHDKHIFPQPTHITPDHYETICFLVEAKKDTYGDLRTEDEKKNDLSVIWLEGETARKILREQVDKVRKGEIKFYNTAFNIVRDQIFFEEIFKDRND